MTRATGMGPLPQLLEVQESSKAVHRAFADAGLPISLISDRQHLVPLHALIRLFERSAQLSGDPVFGLHVGLEMAPQEYGLWLRYSLQAPTLRQGISRLARCLVLHQFGGQLSMEPRGAGRVAWRYWHSDMGDPCAAHHADHVVPVMIQFAQAYLGQHWRPERIKVGYPRDRAFSLREDALGVPWCAGQRSVALVFPARCLAARARSENSVRADAPLLTSIEVLADQRRQEARDPLASVEAIITLRLLDGQTDIGGAAEALGVGPRSLQRILARDGVSYRAVLERVRMKRAKALISETERPLTHIAFDMGYSDPAHFSRAFSRYFGYPPSRLRTAA
ncbi:AraC family transcriptional regulator ligand-binding domain-containing protein [Tropicimonas sp. S265A]|uniref:AraC family transcriptional regulator n=1 Tax=Tropicimonas sp. S265A TaxID=3415134 RepID=UPI003C7E0ABE